MSVSVEFQLYWTSDVNQARLHINLAADTDWVKTVCRVGRVESCIHWVELCAVDARVNVDVSPMKAAHTHTHTHTETAWTGRARAACCDSLLSNVSHCTARNVPGNDRLRLELPAPSFPAAVSPCYQRRQASASDVNISTAARAPLSRFPTIHCFQFALTVVWQQAYAVLFPSILQSAIVLCGQTRRRHCALDWQLWVATPTLRPQSSWVTQLVFVRLFLPLLLMTAWSDYLPKFPPPTCSALQKNNSGKDVG